jgi:hypothetical protein
MKCWDGIIEDRAIVGIDPYPIAKRRIGHIIGSAIIALSAVIAILSLALSVDDGLYLGPADNAAETAAT